jgi:heme/copper-type cytochrome/quinol oxidase subunit 4
MESEKDNSSNTRFYILIFILLILLTVISYFNLKMKTIAPTFENANYDNILKHIKMLRNAKKHT